MAADSVVVVVVGFTVVVVVLVVVGAGWVVVGAVVVGGVGVTSFTTAETIVSTREGAVVVVELGVAVE